MPPKENEQNENRAQIEEKFYSTPHNRKERRHYIGYEGAEFKKIKKYF